MFSKPPAFEIRSLQHLKVQRAECWDCECWHSLGFGARVAHARILGTANVNQRPPSPWGEAGAARGRKDQAEGPGGRSPLHLVLCPPSASFGTPRRYNLLSSAIFIGEKKHDGTPQTSHGGGGCLPKRKLTCQFLGM